MIVWQSPCSCRHLVGSRFVAFIIVECHNLPLALRSISMSSWNCLFCWQKGLINVILYLPWWNCNYSFCKRNICVVQVYVKAFIFFFFGGGVSKPWLKNDFNETFQSHLTNKRTLQLSWGCGISLVNLTLTNTLAIENWTENFSLEKCTLSTS